MYGFVQVLQEAGVFGYIQLFGLFAGGLWALVCAVLLGIRWRVPPVVAVVPLLLPPLVAATGAAWGQAQVEGALANVEPSMRATLMAQGVSEILAQGWFGLCVIPTAALLGIGGLAAGIRGPRSWGMPGVVFLCAGLAALMPVAGLLDYADPVWVIARVLLYGLAVIPVALATANAHPAGNGPEGGVVATTAFASLVGACELAFVSAGWARAFGGLALVDPESRPRMLEAITAELGGHATLAWVTLAIAGIPAVLCAFRGGPVLSEEEILAGHASAAPGRSLARVLALLVWPAWVVAFLALDPSDTLATIARAAR